MHASHSHGEKEVGDRTLLRAVVITGTNVTLTLTAIPEPTTIGLLLFAGVLGIRMLRRKC